MRSLILLACLACPGLLSAQTSFRNHYTQTLGGQSAEFIPTVMIKNTEGYMLLGNGLQFVLMQVDEEGKKIWAKDYVVDNVSVGSMHVGTMHALPDGGYLIAGKAGTMFITRVSKTGEVRWAKQWNGTKETPRQFVLTSDNHFVLAGIGGDNAFNGMLVKGDLDGNIIWSKGYSADITLSESFESIVQTPDGGYIGFGTLNVQTQSSNFYAVKVDAQGAVVWSNLYGNSPVFTFLSGQRIHATADGSYLLTGFESVKFVPGESGVITKIDPTGAVLWTKRIAPIVTDYFASGFIASVLPDESIRMMISQLDHVRVVSMDKNGEHTGTRHYNETNWMEGAHALSSLPDGSLLMSGGHSTYTDGLRGWLFKTAPDGSTACNDSIGNSTISSYDMPKTAMPALPTLNTESHDVTVTASNADIVITSICAVQGVGSIEVQDHSLSISPNPASGAVTVSLLDARDYAPSVIEVIDVTGRMIASYSVNANEVQIPAGVLSAGAYIVRWMSKGYQIAECKLAVR